MATDTKDRLNTLIAKARKETTKAALRACLTNPTRAKWLAAEKAGWGDVPLNTNDCLWLRSKVMELPT
jgi:hypothetical protein